MTKILVLCHANQFRSPLATVVLKAWSKADIKTAGVKEGTFNRRCAKKIREWLIGQKSKNALNEYYYEAVKFIEEHRSVKADNELVQWADVIVYMDSGNLERMQAKFGSLLDGKKLHCLGEFCTPKRNRIEDPAYIAKDSPKLDEVLSYIRDASINLARKYPQ